MRHVVSTPGEEFGRYPNRFRDNTSKRSRSCYVTQSSTHTKTHALSNAAFAAIVARPCHYCGKRSDPPRHHNGLDRLDSSVRVYTEARVASWRSGGGGGRAGSRDGAVPRPEASDGTRARVAPKRIFVEASARLARSVVSGRHRDCARRPPLTPGPRPSAITPRAWPAVRFARVSRGDMRLVLR